MWNFLIKLLLSIVLLKTLEMFEKNNCPSHISINLIKKYWEVGAKDTCLDHFHLISLEGLLKVSDIKSLGRSVW